MRCVPEKKMNIQKAEKILERGGYPTSETIRAFAVVYPKTFETIIRDHYKKLG